MRYTTKILATTALMSGLMCGAAFASSWQFKLVDTIPLPSKAGHGDMVRYDSSNGMIYVSMPEGGAVIDTRTNKIAHVFPKLHAPNDMAFDNDYIYWTDVPGAGKQDYIVVISKKTWQVVNRVKTVGTTPDGLQIDPATHRLYSVMDDNNWVDAWDTSNGADPKFVAKYMLYPPSPPGAGPDVAALAPSINRYFQSDDAWELALDPATGKILYKVDYHIPVTKKGGTKDGYYDPNTKVFWLGTTTSKAGMLLVNPSNLEVMHRLPESGEVDQVAADPGLGLLYAFESPAKGFGVFDLNAEKYITFVKYGTSVTHTGDVDTASHDIYILAGKDNGKAAMLVYKPEKE